MSRLVPAALAALVAAPLLLAAPSAQATCMIQCTAKLMFDDCTSPPDPHTWPAAVPLTVAGSCEVCCSPPGGPVDCSPEPLAAEQMILHQNGVAMAGVFSPLSVACSPDPLYAFSSVMVPGSYELMAPQGMIILSFEVTDDPCVTDADCPLCTVCVFGVCKGLGVAVCTTDADCPEDEKCLVNATAPCASQCIKKDAECATSEDCPVCSGCVNGQCIPGGLVECTDDAHCPGDQVCVTNAAAPCQNHCADATPECMEDGDCGACAVCVSGECKGLGLVVCESDDDCDAGMACQKNATDPCKNQCVPAPECTEDDDCGACAVCVSGECKGLGLVVCESDDDCDAGMACQKNATDPCKNQCVPAPECIGDDDCGACAVCVGGECKGLGLVVCESDGDCDPGMTCKVDATDPCKNACVPGGSDAGPSGDSGAEPDGYEGTDSASGADAGPTGDAAGDSGSGGSSGGSDGCSATGAAPAGALWLLLAAMVRRRRSRTP